MDYKRFMEKAGAILLALVFWQIAAMCIHQNILLVTPLAVMKRLFTIWQVEGFAATLWFTFYHVALGFLLGLILGIFLAFLSAGFHVAEILLWPWIATMRTVPVASFVVICLIWLSPKNLSVFISFLVVMPVIYQNILTGLQNPDTQLEEMAAVFGLPWYRKLSYITIPRLKPYLLSACTVTTGMAWKAAVAAEIIATPNTSIGKMMFTAKMYLDTDDLLAWTVIIVIISVISEKLFLRGVKWILR